MKKMLMKVDLNDERDKRKAMECVTQNTGIDLVSMDMKLKIMTVVGEADPVAVVKKLRKCGWDTEIIYFAPVKS